MAALDQGPRFPRAEARRGLLPALQRAVGPAARLRGTAARARHRPAGPLAPGGYVLPAARRPRPEAHHRHYRDEQPRRWARPDGVLAATVRVVRVPGGGGARNLAPLRRDAARRRAGTAPERDDGG